MNKARTNNSKSFEVTVTDIGVHGDGIANAAGKRYFIPYSVPGDELSVSPDYSRRDGRFAAINRIITASEYRTKPPCDHFGNCGGCALQHVSKAFIARTKRDIVARALAHRDIKHCDILETVSIAPGERRRARLAVHKAKRTAIGFFAPRSRRVIDVERCHAVRPAIAALFDPLRTLIADLDCIQGAAAVQITESDSGIDLLLEPNRPDELSLSDRETLAHFANTNDLARLSWTGPQGVEPVAQRRSPRYRFGPVSILPPPDAFLQPSEAGERTIVAAAGRAVADATRIADLYAGCGALSFPFSSIAPTFAFEGSEAMVETLHRAAGDCPVTATVRDLARNPLTPEELKPFDAVVFDPPRAGAKTQAAALAASSVGTVVAVSCNPGTFARDLRLLVDGGYAIDSVLPIDQFPWSPHVEIVATLRKS